MFTGIVQAIGRVRRFEARGAAARLEIDAGALDHAAVVPGESIAVAGCCLTVLAPDAAGFAVDVSAETLARTTLGALAAGAGVNLERALRLADRLGGHLVSGHVDGVARIVSAPDGGAGNWTFEVPAALTRYLAVKGSICVDGVSLTVNGVDARRFDATLIPHTLAATTFADRRIGDTVNLEVDLIARYLERLAHGAAG